MKSLLHAYVCDARSATALANTCRIRNQALLIMMV
jgi:hypothetical protein